MLVIAHRGANREATENTRKAFELAIEGGCGRIEVDLQITKDEYIVIYHDGEIDHQPISGMSFDATKKLMADKKVELLTIDELLNEFGHKVELNLEIKPEFSKIPALLVDKLKNEKLKPIVISSFYPNPLQECKNLGVPAEIAFLWDYESEEKTTKETYIEVMDDLNCKIFHPHCDMVDKNMMQWAQKKSWLVYPWVPMAGEQNPKELWVKLKELGVDGLCTNIPREMREWLRVT